MIGVAYVCSSFCFDFFRMKIMKSALYGEQHEEANETELDAKMCPAVGLCRIDTNS